MTKQLVVTITCNSVDERDTELRKINYWLQEFSRALVAVPVDTDLPGDIGGYQRDGIEIKAKSQMRKHWPLLSFYHWYLTQRIAANQDVQIFIELQTVFQKP